MNTLTKLSLACALSFSSVAAISAQAPDELRHLPAHAHELRGNPYGDFASSWQNAPYNTSVYQQVNRLIPTATVWRGDAEESQFEYQKQDLSEIQYTNVKGESETFAELLERTFSDGVLILKDGKIITEHYFNGMKPHNRHHLMSSSKSLTSTLFSTFIDDGSVKLDEMVTTYVPDAKNTAWEGVKVIDLLNMTSDVQYREEFDNPDAEVWAHESAVGWRNVGEGRPSTNREFLYSMNKMDSPDGLFHYRSSETDMLGQIMENVSGIGTAELFSRRIWSKLGAEEDAQCLVDREGACVVMGGFGTTLRDLGRWGQMIANNGYFNGQQIISKAWVDRITHGDADKFKHYKGMLPKGAYSAQFWVTDNERNITSTLGYGGQQVYIDRDINLVIVRLSSWDKPDYSYATDSYKAMEAISNHFRDASK
ncbi:serine hydrolase domain-containing protein [Vibrio sinaloensis]|uniref:serine hydrolase domain-containing protein n=1 Tax=Photobacterium sp. (strain ATCC 43367) TaxID=379097 RepID=UPI00206E89F3|nr:serine hydrolase [Vibrio sinaloensis]UPQ89055.1 beta-lactamase family protein [Vibrio sinaloensis]